LASARENLVMVALTSLAEVSVVGAELPHPTIANVIKAVAKGASRRCAIAGTLSADYVGTTLATHAARP
jgi:hypothetical protein